MPTKMYRLKTEAVKFFLEEHATSIYSLDTWESIGVDIKALDEVEPAYIKYGHPLGDDGQSISGWSKKDGTRFHFTIFFPSTTWHENDKITKGLMSRNLMNRIQHSIDAFYSEFMQGNISLD